MSERAVIWKNNFNNFWDESEQDLNDSFSRILRFLDDVVLILLQELLPGNSSWGLFTSFSTQLNLTSKTFRALNGRLLGQIHKESHRTAKNRRIAECFPGVRFYCVFEDNISKVKYCLNDVSENVRRTLQNSLSFDSQLSRAFRFLYVLYFCTDIAGSSQFPGHTVFVHV